MSRIETRLTALEKQGGHGGLTSADKALMAQLAAGDRDIDDVTTEELERLIRARGGTVPDYDAMSTEELLARRAARAARRAAE